MQLAQKCSQDRTQVLLSAMTAQQHSAGNPNRLCSKLLAPGSPFGNQNPEVISLRALAVISPMWQNQEASTVDEQGKGAGTCRSVLQMMHLLTCRICKQQAESPCAATAGKQQMLDTVPDASLPGHSSNTATIYCTKVQEETDSSKNTGAKHTLWVSTTRL